MPASHREQHVVTNPGLVLGGEQVALDGPKYATASSGSVAVAFVASTSASTPTSASSKPPPVMRSTPSERLMRTTSCPPRSRAAAVAPRRCGRSLRRLRCASMNVLGSWPDGGRSRTGRGGVSCALATTAPSAGPIRGRITNRLPRSGLPSVSVRVWASMPTGVRVLDRRLSSRPRRQTANGRCSSV